MGRENECRLVREGIWNLVVDPEIWTRDLCEVILVHLNASSKNPTRHPQLLRDIGRVLKVGGVIVISSPNFLSRLRLGSVRGRVRPVYYTRGTGQLPNIYLIHFYELYYLLFDYRFVMEELKRTQIKFASVFFAPLLYLFIWLFSLEAVIRAEKDPRQRRINWQIL